MMPAAPAFRGGEFSDSGPALRLAEQLKLAWIHAGRPSMGDVGDAVGYSKASISKVLSGKMPPAWHLVRKLGAALGVPVEIVQGEWHELWAAADELRHHRPAEPQQCPQCGGWVADPRVHQLWHRAIQDAGPPQNLPEVHRWASLRDAVQGRDARNAQTFKDQPGRTTRNEPPC